MHTKFGQTWARTFGGDVDDEQTTDEVGLVTTDLSSNVG